MIARAALNMGLRQVMQVAFGQARKAPEYFSKLRGESQKIEVEEVLETEVLSKEQSLPRPFVAVDEPRPLPKVSLKPLFDAPAMELFYWLSDELEMASPSLTLHAGVAVSTILAASGPLSDDLMQAHIEILIVDETGLPVAALLFDDEECRRSDDEDSERVDEIATILERAELPALVVDPEDDYDMIWQELHPLIEYEIAA